MGKASMWYATIRGALPGDQYSVTFVPPSTIAVRSRANHRNVSLAVGEIDGHPAASVVGLLRAALGGPADTSPGRAAP